MCCSLEAGPPATYKCLIFCTTPNAVVARFPGQVVAYFPPTPCTMNTPTTSSGGSTHGQTYCEARWAEALSRCEKDLPPTDFDTINQFETPEALLANLHAMEVTYSSGAIPTILKQIEPSLRHLRSFTGVLAIGSQTSFVKTAAIWGVLNLLIQVKCNIIHTNSTQCNDCAVSSQLRGNLARNYQHAKRAWP